MANPTGAGRPTGSIQTPHSLLKNELKATAQTLAKVRTFIEEQLQLVKTDLKNATLAERLGAIDTITSVTEKLGKVMDAAAKNLAPKQAGGEEGSSASNQDPAKILEELMGGRR